MAGTHTISIAGAIRGSTTGKMKNNVILHTMQRFLMCMTLALALAGRPSVSLAVSPEDLYQEASSAFAAGDLATAEKDLVEFRKEHETHQLYWSATLMWARCAKEPGEAERRFREAAEKAPPETKAECELEIARMLVMRDKFPEAEKAFSDWLAANPGDERGESAHYWHSFCLKQTGRTDEAIKEAGSLRSEGGQDQWRALAGLLLAGMKSDAGDAAGAHEEYAALVATEWASGIGPQALLGAAKTSPTEWERKKLLNELTRKYPDSPEAGEAAKLLKTPGRVVTPRFGVQVGAYSKMANAQIEKKRVVAQGRKAAIIKRTQAGLSLFSVIIGPFATRAEAETAAREIRESGLAAVAYVTTY